MLIVSTSCSIQSSTSSPWENEKLVYLCFFYYNASVSHLHNIYPLNLKIQFAKLLTKVESMEDENVTKIVKI